MARAKCWSRLSVEEAAKKLNERKKYLENQYKCWIHSLRYQNWFWLIFEWYEEVTEVTSPDGVDYRLWKDWVWVEI